MLWVPTRNKKQQKQNKETKKQKTQLGCIILGIYYIFHGQALDLQSAPARIENTLSLHSRGALHNDHNWNLEKILF